MPSPRVFRGLALALALALTPTASVLGAAAPVSGLTDASPLVTRAGAPDASLCEDGESGHRKATTAGDAHLKLDELDEAEACYLCLLYTSPSPRDATLSRMPSSA